MFVADVVPAELQRVVESLNERMSPTEVIAVEIRQYTGGGEQMLVPRVLGQTAGARRRKSSAGVPGSRWRRRSGASPGCLDPTSGGHRRGVNEGRIHPSPIGCATYDRAGIKA